jgi:predicted ester cyclase
MDAAELVRTFFEDVMTEGRLEQCEEIVGADYHEHALAPFGTVEPGHVDGPEHLMATAKWLRDQFPDIRMEVERVVAEADMVAVLVNSAGTNLGMLNGMIPPTGCRFRARQSHWFRIEGGRLAEHRATRDDLSVMMQLGCDPYPECSHAVASAFPVSGAWSDRVEMTHVAG